METLEELRERIDSLDKTLREAFLARMQAAAAVAGYKAQHGLPVLDAAREEAVVEKNLAALAGDEKAMAPYYEDFVRHNMALSRALQQALLGRGAVAYQGVEGAFSHIALRRLFPHARAVGFAAWADVFRAVENGEAEYGVLPFENSSVGDVSEVLDLCFSHPKLCVCDVYDLPVGQNLLGVPGAALGDVKTVFSHPQALHQCAGFIKTLSLAQQEAANTALAAQEVARRGDKALAAIASEETAGLYGLRVLARNINGSEDNTTRFIVIGKALREKGNRFSLLFTVDHKAGALARVMRVIGEEGFNLECIKSRPMPHVAWEYYFYAELVGDCSGAAAQALLEKLGAVCRTVRVLGVYSRGAAERSPL